LNSLQQNHAEEKSEQSHVDESGSLISNVMKYHQWFRWFFFKSTAGVADVQGWFKTNQISPENIEISVCLGLFRSKIRWESFSHRAHLLSENNAIQGRHLNGSLRNS